MPPLWQIDAVGQKSLFGDLEEEVEEVSNAALPEIPEIEERQRLAMEKEVLGFYLSSPPAGGI